MVDYFVQYESELTIESNGTAGSIYGQYKCIVTDEGNPQDKRDNMLVEYSFFLTKEPGDIESTSEQSSDDRIDVYKYIFARHRVSCGYHRFHGCGHSCRPFLSPSQAPLQRGNFGKRGRLVQNEYATQTLPQLRLHLGSKRIREPAVSTAQRRR